MRLLSWNVNGVRSIHKKGFHKWLDDQDADIICLQETKANIEQLDETLAKPKGYESYWFSAEKKGYSGVATLTKSEPLSVRFGFGLKQADSEGRVLTTEFKNFTVVNAYFPNSQRDHARLPFKLQFCEHMLNYCQELRAQGKNVILCGDFNIAHQEIDLKNPKSNHGTAGFLPQERAWLDHFLKQPYVDIFRNFEKGGGHYTWWSYRPGVREKNIGWRIDYHVVNQEFADRVEIARHQPMTMGSDHCPVELVLKK